MNQINQRSDQIFGMKFKVNSICGDKWCVCGDFNVVRSINEKSPNEKLKSSMRCFDSLITELELCDPPLLNASFTWSNMRAEQVCCRLDHFLFTTGWMEFFPSFKHEVPCRLTSDHFPIIRDTNMVKWGLSPFRFENIWLKHSRTGTSKRRLLDGGTTDLMMDGQATNLLPLLGMINPLCLSSPQIMTHPLHLPSHGIFTFFFCNLKDCDLQDLGSLLGQLEGIKLGENEVDVRRWILDSSGMFSCKSFFFFFFFLS